MKVTVKFFASVREVVGARSQTIEIADGCTVGDLWRQYAEKYPRLTKLGLGYAVNHEYAMADRVLHDGDEVALIPPVSGG
jgi:molybdopterin converting factor subunit 1